MFYEIQLYLQKLVERVFSDDGASGGIFERKSIQELLKYLDTNSQNSYVVIFEDLNRLSRDIQVHNLLRTEFRKRGVELQCPNFQFDETPEWDFKENISVAMAQYERKKNTQRVISRQWERLKDGYWCFNFPIWYRYEKDTGKGGKILIKDDNWKIIKSALEKYASNELESLNDVARYFRKKWVKIWTIQKEKVLNTSSISRAFRNMLYTGYLECEKMWIERTKAKHPALISLKTFEKIQAKLDTMKHNQYEYVKANLERKDLTEDFPLRGFLYCEHSKQFLSWAWSQWKQKKFPYYTYPRKSPIHGKSINRDIFHWEFEQLLKAIQPKEDVLESFSEALDMLREENKNGDTERREILDKQLIQVERKISNYLSRIGETESVTLAENYEQKLLECEREKTQILKNIWELWKDVWTPFKRKIKMVRNSLDIWKNGDLEKKKTLIRNIFPEWIPMNEKKQVWIPTFSLVYQTLSLWERGTFEMVDPPGFEPGTYRLRGFFKASFALF